MMLRPRILVNGATGALGRVTMAALGDQVAIAGTRREPAPFAASIHVPADGRVDPAFLRGIDIIVNCAGRVDGTDTELRAANVDHVRNLTFAAQAAGVRRFVQVSSFSVYGPVEVIDAYSSVAPLTTYGRSKAEAERVLDGMGGGLSTISVRLPFLFDRERPSLLGPLVALFRRMPVFPVAPYPVCRSMLTYADAAALLVDAARSDRQGAVCAADPRPFSMDLLKRLMREVGLQAPVLVRIPRSIIGLVGRVRPTIGARLFASSQVAADANWASGRGLPVGLEMEIRNLLARQSGARI